MKKINLLGYLSMALILLFTSCDQQSEMEILESSNSSIQIDKSKQILLEPTTLTKSEISEVSCGDSKVVTLTAGQHIDVGTVTVSNDETNLYVVYETTGNWVITETHLYVGPEAGIPLNGGGNPRIGHFPYHGTDDTPFTIPLADLGDDFVIVAHAVVDKVMDGQTVQSETAFGCGEFSFPGNRWGCYFDYDKQDCEEEECMDAFGFKTINPSHSICFLQDGFSQWGWTNWFIHENMVWGQAIYGNLTFPLFSNAEECDISDATEVGSVEVYFFSESYGDGKKFYVSVDFKITDSSYKFKEINLFVGNAKYPVDGDNNSTINPSYFNYSEDNLNVSEYTFNNIEWTSGNKEKGYIIPHVKVCKVNDI